MALADVLLCRHGWLLCRSSRAPTAGVSQRANGGVPQLACPSGGRSHAPLPTAICLAPRHLQDPFAVLGPEGAARAIIHGELSAMELYRRLGDSRCAKCRKRGATFWCFKMLERSCCDSGCGKPCCCKILLNRFLFAGRGESAATRVSNEEELQAFLEHVNSSGPDEVRDCRRASTGV